MDVLKNAWNWLLAGFFTALGVAWAMWERAKRKGSERDREKARRKRGETLERARKYQRELLRKREEGAEERVDEDVEKVLEKHGDDGPSYLRDPYRLRDDD